MKSTFTKIAFTSLALLSLTAFAAPHGTPEKWAGSGVVYSPAGEALGTYKIELTVTPAADNPQAFQSVAKITKQDGSVMTITEEITPDGHGFQVVSNLGKGGGSCYGDDICESYVAAQNGLAYASTVAIDGQNARRDLTFELQDGKAVRVLRDTLTRVN